MSISIRHTGVEDYSQLISLYKEVAAKSGGIIRIDDEINFDYVNMFIENSLRNGLSLVAVVDSRVVAEIHGYTPEIYAFRHMLSDLTIVVLPEFQNQGIGKKLFLKFLKTVQEEFQHILRVELYVREENKPIVEFYESLGFINEGRQKNKILNRANELETPLHMAWFNPSFMPTGSGK
jgi:putative acetyltransferase